MSHPASESDDEAVGKIDTPAKPTRNIPLLFEPLKAYRHWKISAEQLTAPYQSGIHSVWKDGENVSWCKLLGTPSTQHRKIRHPNTTTFYDCSCGYYSVWQDGHDYARDTNLISSEIFGVVELYGNVCIGVHGARATKARIVALHLPPGIWTPFNKGRTNALMENYPSVRFYRSRENLIKGEGVEYPTSLINSTYSGSNFG